MQNNKMVLGLVLAMFVLVMAPNSASAKVVGGGGQYLLVSEGYVAPVNPTPVQTVAKKPAPGVVTQGATTKKVASVSTKGASTTTETGEVRGVSDSSNLSANASSSGISFMPDTLLEWIFLFILILLGVKLWRNATVTEKEKHAPLKHA
ncbi:MAG: hypothetical protein NTW98_01470 [Candidatus Nomurabacteria bacterium]|nr:hypothetical protein [Candidatus Nomurabacteria bacterium]